MRDRTGDLLISACYMVFRFPSSRKIIWMMTFIAAIVLGLDIGLLVSVSFAFFVITMQSHRYLVLGKRSLAMAGRATMTYRQMHFLSELRFSSWVRSLTPTSIEASTTIGR